MACAVAIDSTRTKRKKIVMQASSPAFRPGNSYNPTRGLNPNPLHEVELPKFVATVDVKHPGAAFGHKANEDMACLNTTTSTSGHGIANSKLRNFPERCVKPLRTEDASSNLT